jgi:hypothetical protein
MMALSEGDRAIVHEVASEAAKTIGDELKKDFAVQIDLHQARCPIGKDMDAMRNQAKGGWKVVAIIAALIGTVASLLVTHFWK